MTLLERLKTKLTIPPNFMSLSEEQVQYALTAQLRALAVNYLGNTSIKTALTCAFRGEYMATSQVGEHYKTYLARQSKNKVWGTYIEATAMGEALGCNVMVTPITKDGAQQKTFPLYHTGNPDAPVVHLYNSGNTHWHVGKHNHTLDDNNCLYNAFAQSLRNAVLIEAHKRSPSSTITFYGNKEKSRLNVQREEIKAQINAYIAIQSTSFSFQTPEQALVQQKRETLRISLLSPHEQEQIAADYKLALSLAQDELSYTKYNIYSSSKMDKINADLKFDTEDTYQASSIRVH